MRALIIHPRDEVARRFAAALADAGASVTIAAALPRTRCAVDPFDVLLVEAGLVARVEIQDGDGPALLAIGDPPATDSGPGRSLGIVDHLGDGAAPARIVAVARRALRETTWLARVAARGAVLRSRMVDIEEDLALLESRRAMLRGAEQERRSRELSLPAALEPLLAGVEQSVALELSLEGTALDPTCRSALEDTLAALDRVRRMALDLRDVSRAGDGELRPELTAFALAPLVTRVVAAMGRVATDYEVALAVDPGIGEPSVHADPVLVRRAIANLVERAVRQSRRGRVRISASTSEDGREVTVAVEDTGPALPAALGPRVFDRLSRLDPGAASFHRGMSLPFCAEVARCCGGRVEAGPRPAGGARFALVLPSAARTDGVARRVA